MDFHGIPVSSIWTAIQWLPAFILRKRFPRERLAALQYVDIVPRNESAMVNLGECASFEIWLNVINLSPFEVELDRAEFEFSYAGAGLKATVLRKQKFAPGEIAIFQISNPISDGVANQIVRTLKVNHPHLEGALSGHIEFNCKLHPFPRQLHYLSGIRPRLLNENFRVQT